MKVIDISDDQKGLNFDLVEKAKVKGCVVQVCDGTYLLDFYPCFFNACRAHNLSIGVSCMSCAFDEEEAETEATALINGVERLGIKDVPLHMWITFNQDLAETIDSETLAAIANTFISTCNENGYLAGVCADESTLSLIATHGLNEGTMLWCTTPNADIGQDIDCESVGSETIGAKEIKVNKFF